MVIVNREGYIIKRINSSNYRDWWLVPAKKNKCSFVGNINLILPKEYIGKKIRIKIELLKKPNKKKRASIKFK